MTRCQTAQHMERFEEVCRKKGVKLTHQRMEIFREVAQSTAHPDAEAVYRGVHQRIPALSLDTVYRTLWLLKDLGLVTTLGPPRERSRFDANLNRHHHFICKICGAANDFFSDAFNELNVSDCVKDIGHVETIQVQGICLSCADKGETGTNPEKSKQTT